METFSRGSNTVVEFNIERKMIKTNGLNLFCRDTGGDGTAMLCLHGRWGRGETWIDLISRYAGRYRVIAPDQRGHGLSDRPMARYAGEDLAGDAHGLIQRLNCGLVIVVGHSMGGRVAAYLTALYPLDVKALAILDEPAEGREKLSDLAPEKIAPVDKLTTDWPTPYPSYDAAVRHLSERFPRSTNVRYFMDSLMETAAGYDYMFSRHAMSAINQYSQRWHHLLPQLKCPVLLVRAAESWCLLAEEAAGMRTAIEDCTYFEVSDSDHMVYADNPGEFYSGFEEFLQKVEGP